MAQTTTELDNILRLATSEDRTVTHMPDPEPEPLFCPIISVDDHAFEPPSAFTSRVPAALQERVPHVIEQDGYPFWIVEDEAFPFILANGSVGRPVNERHQSAQRMVDFRPGVHELPARVHDMDLCGIWAMMCFPSMTWGFAGSRFLKMRDTEAALASVRAYNDWMLDEWCGSYPERFIPCQLTWLADPLIAAEEIRRNAARGYHAVSFIENPEPLGLPSIHSRHWDPFFAACEETDTVVNLHVGSSGLIAKPSSDSPGPVSVALFPLGGIMAAVDWVFAKIPLRFPGLKVALSEAGVSWVPMVIDRLHRSERMMASKDWDLAGPTPLELFKRNFYFTSIEDPVAFQLLDLIGEDKVMVETDYPHGDSTWPGCQAMIQSEMTDLDPPRIRKVCYENAAALYHHPLPPDELIARSFAGRDLR